MRESRLSEEVWGTDDFNPFEIRVEAGQHVAWGSYISGLPEYNNPELEGSYYYIKEFSKWAIENRVCNKCRFPWIEYYRACNCGKYDENHIRIAEAEKHATKILDYDKQQVLAWAKQIEIDLEGDSEYARLNRKAREVMGRCIARCNNTPPTFFERTKIKCKSVWRKVSNWFWRFTTPKAQRVKSIPIYAASTKEIKDLSFGNPKVSSGNVCVRTKGGSVVVVPAGMVDKLRGEYKGGEIIAPIVKD